LTTTCDVTRNVSPPDDVKAELQTYVLEKTIPRTLRNRRLRVYGSPMGIKALRARLRGDFQLAIVTLFGACSVLLIFPFAIYRALTHNWPVATLDSLIVLGITLPVLYAWRTGDSKRPGIVLVVIYSSGAVISAAMLGVAGLFWMYATILANFFLVGRRPAAAITIVSLLILVFIGKGFSDTPQMLSFVCTSSLVSILAFVLANRTEAQRKQLERLATRDPLTGAYNRRVMTEELDIAVGAFKRHRTPMSLIILDIDHFKQINDRFGHAEGDKVLIALTHMINQTTRSADRFFRYGGEEFVLLLPAVSFEDLPAIAEKLRLRINMDLQCDDSGVTVSFGAASLREGEDWQAWLRRADGALYKAKAAGRNLVMID
jgi:diguanylate cyclase